MAFLLWLLRNEFTPEAQVDRKTRCAESLVDRGRWLLRRPWRRRPPNALRGAAKKFSWWCLRFVFLTPGELLQGEAIRGLVEDFAADTRDPNRRRIVRNPDGGGSPLPWVRHRTGAGVAWGDSLASWARTGIARALSGLWSPGGVIGKTATRRDRPGVRHLKGEAEGAIPSRHELARDRPALGPAHPLFPRLSDLEAEALQLK